MKKFLAACLVPACIAAVAVPISVVLSQPVAQAAPASQWRTIKGDGFTIQMPGNPTIEQSVENFDGNPVDVVVYRLQPPTTGYMVMTYDLPVSFNPKSKAAQDMIDSVMQPMLASKRGKVVSQQSMALGGYPGREATIKDRDGTGTAKARLFLVNNRVYAILTASSGNLNPATTAQYLRSFKLTNQ
jgi:hypothetical protein